MNRHKPSKCPACGYKLGGNFPGPKKQKKSIPDAVAVTDNIVSVRTSNQGDRCYVCKEDNLWICLHDKCKQRRASYHASGKLAQFSCDHIEKASNPLTPMACYSPQRSNTSEYPCSEKIQGELFSIIDDATKRQYPIVSKVSDSMYSVYGPPSASNTVGFCHVKQLNEKHMFVCTGKDCRGIASKGKQARTKAACIHLHIIYFTLNMSNKVDSSQKEDLHGCDSVPAENVPKPTEEEESSVSRKSTLQLAEIESTFPYVVPRPTLAKIMQLDASTLFGMAGGWPENFSPATNKCGLCNEDLGKNVKHNGQRGSGYLISELNAFKKCEIFVKLCQNKSCQAMNRAQFSDYGK